ncbi:MULTISPECIES: amidohydrolase [Brevibacillus]|jgi:cytosine/adenosine deaminase-related metal-dependent hydrolase|uniref:amidohydrolase n=1 Tax=Brevibacillus TaxID=55080 RepID=UPI000EBBB1B1|nr:MULTISPECIES: amidohydrolase [Brevibacillus]MBU8712979.1 amidohydrolase family protein [Brevibacillus parabrevis]MDH6348497.1 cytosine/adenosine deaminase-related metal-dependent hydrolase [Brevibacillus sp. 1238]MDR5002355.1 amidohydrolase [Brevibacillus parabrevis]MED2256412.1 amidohydrolase [Brevibacillus parabrevis]NRQ53007.1 amidohydrolase family protein [Brevibacillus sp. HD1.4A]
MGTAYWLTNVRLETGYRRENGVVAGTDASLFHILIKDGKFARIAQATETLADDLPQKDAKGLLALPSFIEKHVHLDKTLLGEPWRAVIPVANIIERCEIEKRALPALPTTTQERAENLLSVLLSYGSTHVRTHVDIYPEAGISNLESVQAALATYANRVTHEIVAFPQHGLLRTDAQPLLREALRQGATHVGGVDPATVDGDLEQSLHQMMELAVEANAGVDLHLHDPGHLGTFTMKRLAAMTVDAGWQGRVAISHAFALGDIPVPEAEEMATILREAGITIISSVPFSRAIPPVSLLHQNGVDVALGCDNIFDTWQPYGNGDVLERLWRLAERNRWLDELALSQSLRFITGGKTTLDANGTQLWPAVGEEASLVLVEASCSAEAIARRADRQAVFFKGSQVAGQVEEATTTKG